MPRVQLAGVRSIPFLKPPILIFGYGNPSRGDDAIGPEFIERFYARIKGTTLDDQIELITDFQLQIEHVLDMEGRDRVIFVDASTSGELESFSLIPLEADKQIGYTTHAMSPQSVMGVYQQVMDQPLPRVHMLSIRGYQFKLGEEISLHSSRHINEAIQVVIDLFSIKDSR
jgi:hydrogenase maturation protease